MRAIVLSAGQGKRLLPLTADVPKCLLAVEGEHTVLDLQLETLARCGIARASVVCGFGIQHVEHFLARKRLPGLAVDVIFNPFFSVSDNLATCWIAREAMDGDFLLLNGDTLFEPAVLRRLLASPPAPITVTVDHKDRYDDDDMKVSMDAGGRLLAIGKQLDPALVHAESIGLICFRGAGVRRFREAVEATMRSPQALRSWYLSVVNSLAPEGCVATASVRGLWWREIDSREDLEEVRRSLAGASPESREAASR